MRRPDFFEVMIEYDYSKFPLNDTISINFEEAYCMAKNITCPCGSGLLIEDCHNELNRKSAVVTAWNKFMKIDEDIINLKQENNVDFVCEKNCNKCCDYYFYISAVEYFTIKFHLMSRDEIFWENCIKKGKELYLKLKKEYPDEVTKLEKYNDDIDAHYANHEVLEKFCMCPFADLKNMGCKAYMARPLVCRLYGTSYGYGYCEKIRKKIKSFLSKKISVKKVKKHMIGLAYDKKLLTDFDYGTVATSPLMGVSNRIILERPYPILYWLANDEIYTEKYNMAINSSKNDYWISQENQKQ